MARSSARVATRYLRSGMFDIPGALYETIEDWVQSKIEASWGGEWKSFRKDFPLTEKSLEDWRYLARLQRFPNALETALKSTPPLRVIAKRVSPKQGLSSAGSWTPHGNTLTLVFISSTPSPEKWRATLRHEIRHFCQYFMEKVLASAELRSFPGTAGVARSDRVHQNSTLKRPADRSTAHALDDSEFYPKLGSEIDYWKSLAEDEDYAALPYDVQLAAQRWYVGADRLPRIPAPQWLTDRLAGPTLTSIFGPLKRFNPAKWRRAVKLFFTALEPV